MPDPSRVEQLMSYEDGTLGGRETVELFADLVRTGLAWKLQGHYGRTARAMLDDGLIDHGGNIDLVKLETLLAS